MLRVIVGLHPPHGEDLGHLQFVEVIVKFLRSPIRSLIVLLFLDCLGGQEVRDADESADGGDSAVLEAPVCLQTAFKIPILLPYLVLFLGLDTNPRFALDVR